MSNYFGAPTNTHHTLGHKLAGYPPLPRCLGIGPTRNLPLSERYAEEAWRRSSRWRRSKARGRRSKARGRGLRRRHSEEEPNQGWIHIRIRILLWGSRWRRCRRKCRRRRWWRSKSSSSAACKTSSQGPHVQPDNIELLIPNPGQAGTPRVALNMALRIDLVEHGVRAGCRLGTQLCTGFGARGARHGCAVASEVGVLTNEKLGPGDCVECLVPRGTLRECGAGRASSWVGRRRCALSSSCPGGAFHDCAELAVLDPGQGAGLVRFEVANGVFIVVHSADALPALSITHLYTCLQGIDVLEYLI